jgi:lysophospholipase L1-like esterase
MKLRNCLIAIAAVVIALGFGEILLRAFLPFYFCDNHGIYIFDPELEIILKKNLSISRSKDYLEEYITNDLGTANYQNDFSRYRYLVFAIGDSYTQGIGLPPDASFPFQLDLTLNMADGKYNCDYGVVNLGVASYGAQQELLRLNRYVQIIGKPHFILLQGCRNDYHDDLKFHAFKQGKSHNLIEGDPKWNWCIKPLYWLGYETEIGKRLYWRIYNYQKKSYVSPAGVVPPPEIGTGLLRESPAGPGNGC